MNFSPQEKVLIQGICTTAGTHFTPLMQRYGTPIVAGISSGHGGQQQAGVPVFDLVEQATAVLGSVTTAIIFEPPYLVLDAALEAIAAGIRQLILVSAGVPPLDMVRLLRKADATETLILGPNSPGVILPGQILLGTHPSACYCPGSVGVVSRSGTLTAEVALELSRVGLGQSLVVSIGSDAIVGSNLTQWLQILDEDERTQVIVLIGEVGGDQEEIAAHYIAATIEKPVVAYLAGRSAPPDKLLPGHASEIRLWHREAAIVAQQRERQLDIGTAQSKLDALAQAGVPVADRPSQVPTLVGEVLSVISAPQSPTSAG